MSENNQCKKTTYSSKEFADLDVARFANSSREKKPTYSYRCKICQGWHITSRDNYQTKLRKVEKELLETKLLLESKDKELLKRIHEVKNLKTEIELLKKKR